MIQFNLLPDVKIQYIKAKKMRRTIIGGSVIVGGVSVVILVLLFIGVSVVQKNKLNNLSKQIDTKVGQLQSTEDLNKLLTVQNQLNSVSQLHDTKVVASRLPKFIAQFTPTDVRIQTVNVDFVEPKVTITGGADRIESINRFADTLKFTEYTVVGTTEKLKAFPTVVLDSFAKATQTSTEQDGATYTISFTYDPIVFASVLTDQKTAEGKNIPQADLVTLSIPNIISSRSETEKPGILFRQNNTSDTENQ